MTTAKPHISVAMITYNHERFVGEAVRSVLEQTYRDFELIVVDDGSTDATGEIVRSFMDPRILYVRQDNQGPSEARNAALRAARGTVIAQISGDDVAEPTRLEEQLDHLRQHPNSLVFTHFVFIGEDGRPFDHPRWRHLATKANWTREATLRHLYLEGNCFLAPSALASRAAFDAVGPYNAAMLQVQDYDMWVRMLIRGYVPHVVQRPLMRHRVRPEGQNLSDSRPATRARAYFEMQHLLRAFLAIERAQRVAEIFPEVTALGYPLDDDLVHFLLAMIALKVQSPRDVRQAFAANLLIEMMADPDVRTMLSQKTGFRPPDLFRLIGQIDPPFEVECLRTRLNGVQQELDNLTRSRTWRIASTLRDLSRGTRTLINRV
jgi:glycosyltransferase involved in cell wall biosynthesis